MVEFPQIPGIERGALLAAFAGAVAVLCTQERMPATKAALYVIAGGAVAAYLGPGIIEYLQSGYNIKLGERSQYALIFMTGVSGIWLLQITTAILAEIKTRASAFVTAFLDRVAGGGGPKP
jgi:hypothetical protein